MAGEAVGYQSEASIRFAYLHGFASGPNAAKGLMLKASFARAGLHLELPDLNRPSFQTMTFTAALAELDQMHAAALSTSQNIKWQLIGSSMGSYLAALWAQLHPDWVDKLVLLSPAFNFAKVVARMGGDDLVHQWQTSGSWTCLGPDGAPSKIHWGLVEDIERYAAEPDVPCPTLVFQGRSDALVQLESTSAYARSHPSVELVVLDDDHALIKSMPIIVGHVSRFFGLVPALTASDPPERQIAQLDHSVDPAVETGRTAKL